MKKICAVILALSFTGFLAVNAKELSTMDKVMESWVGENIDAVINVWGYPKEEKTIVGRKLLYWKDIRNSQYVLNDLTDGATIKEYSCTRILEINENNIVKSWQYEGNICPNFYFTASSWVNPNNDPWKQEKEAKKNAKLNAKINK